MSENFKINKEMANSIFYYDLFKNKIGSFHNNDDILLLHIGNFDVIRKFMINNLNCNYFIIDQADKEIWWKTSFSSAKFYGTEDSEESINKALEILNMKFDKIIMNPPWGDSFSVGIAKSILEKSFQFVKDKDDASIICLYGESEIYGVHNKNRMKCYQHCDLVELTNTDKAFNISSRIQGIVSRFYPNKNFEKVTIIDNQGKGRSGIYNWNNIKINQMPKKVTDLFEITNDVYDILYKNSLQDGMCNLSNEFFEYFENKIKKIPNHKNKDVINSKYKFILNHTSYENLYDPIYDYVKNIGGISWTCKNKNIQKNMYYWLHDSSLVFLWRKVLINGTTAACFAYKIIPTVDFNIPHEDFIKFEKSLANGFSQKYSIKYICDLIQQKQ